MGQQATASVPHIFIPPWARCMASRFMFYYCLPLSHWPFLQPVTAFPCFLSCNLKRNPARCSSLSGLLRPSKSAKTKLSRLPTMFLFWIYCRASCCATSNRADTFSKTSVRAQCETFPPQSHSRFSEQKTEEQLSGPDEPQRIERRAGVPTFVYLFPWLILLILQTHHTSEHMRPFNHAHTHVICVKRGSVWKGLIHYFLALIGACKKDKERESERYREGGAGKCHLGGEPSGSAKWVDSYANAC